MKDLPKIFKNKIENINNNKTISREKKDDIDINSKITELFKDKQLYKKDLIITTDKDYVKRILLRREDYLISMENEKIKISDIKDIRYK